MIIKYTYYILILFIFLKRNFNFKTQNFNKYKLSMFKLNTLIVLFILCITLPSIFTIKLESKANMENQLGQDPYIVSSETGSRNL
jgi:hypothetical protein